VLVCELPAMQSPTSQNPSHSHSHSAPLSPSQPPATSLRTPLPQRLRFAASLRASRPLIPSSAPRQRRSISRVKLESPQWAWVLASPCLAHGAHWSPIWCAPVHLNLGAAFSASALVAYIAGSAPEGACCATATAERQADAATRRSRCFMWRANSATPYGNWAETHLLLGKCLRRLTYPEKVSSTVVLACL